MQACVQNKTKQNRKTAPSKLAGEWTRTMNLPVSVQRGVNSLCDWVRLACSVSCLPPHTHSLCMLGFPCVSVSSWRKCNGSQRGKHISFKTWYRGWECSWVAEPSPNPCKALDSILGTATLQRPCPLGKLPGCPQRTSAEVALHPLGSDPSSTDVNS